MNQVQNEIFPHFREFESYVFLEMTYDDSLQQFLTSSRGKIHEKSFGAQICALQAKISLKIRGFFAIFSCLIR